MNVYITRINGLPSGDVVQYRHNMVAKLAHELGIKEMGIYRYHVDGESADSMNARMDGIIAGINGGDLVICQFPTGNGLKFEWTLINHLKAYGARVAIFLHDLEPLLYGEKCFALGEIVNLYNQAEVLIVPSCAMRQFLLDNRIRKTMKFIIQEMWDFPVNDVFLRAPAFKKEIACLDDGIKEMLKWNSISNMSGLSPDETFLMLSKGGFGLVWYRNSCDRRYMEYSASFSLARFLSAGIPVVVPSETSSQILVEKNHLGFVVHSLDEAMVQIDAVNETDYQEFVRCVEEFAPALRKGYYIKKCLLETMQAFYRKDIHRISIPAKVYTLENPFFTYIVLRESYGDNLALSWSYKGNADGFLIYDAVGNLIYETDNMHCHYCQIKGYEKESGFIVKAYIETLKGRLVIAESKQAYLCFEIYESPEVSLIIPAYNAEEYIARSVDTALAQSFFNLEIIIVDDGSADGTKDILDWYAEKYPNVEVIYQENGGTPAARNTGILHAHGDYIGFMDNDDMIHPDMVKRLYRSAKKNDCDLAVTSVYQIRNSGYEAFIQYPVEEDVKMPIEDFFNMHFTKGCMFAVVIWNKLYRSSLVKSRLIPLIIADDNAWTPYILSYADGICYLDDCSYEWDRKIRSSTQVDKWQKRSMKELFDTHKNTILFYLENGNPDRRGLLKQLAERQLSELGRVYGYEEYRRLWDQIRKRF